MPRHANVLITRYLPGFVLNKLLWIGTNDKDDEDLRGERFMNHPVRNQPGQPEIFIEQPKGKEVKYGTGKPEGEHVTG